MYLFLRGALFSCCYYHPALNKWGNWGQLTQVVSIGNLLPGLFNHHRSSHLAEVKAKSFGCQSGKKKKKPKAMQLPTRPFMVCPPCLLNLLNLSAYLLLLYPPWFHLTGSNTLSMLLPRDWLFRPLVLRYPLGLLWFPPETAFLTVLKKVAIALSPSGPSALFFPLHSSDRV